MIKNLTNFSFAGHGLGDKEKFEFSLLFDL